MKKDIFDLGLVIVGLITIILAIIDYKSFHWIWLIIFVVWICIAIGETFVKKRRYP